MKAKTETVQGAVVNGDMAKAFDEAFDFVRAVVEKPDVLSRLPAKASLSLRSIDVQGHPIQLAAARSVEPNDDAWTAHIARWSIEETSSSFLRPILDDRGFAHDQQAVMAQFRETRETAEAALDALERRLRLAFSEALRVDEGR
jgi:hypothetical protein